MFLVKGTPEIHYNVAYFTGWKSQGHLEKYRFCWRGQGLSHFHEFDVPLERDHWCWVSWGALGVSLGGSRGALGSFEIPLHVNLGPLGQYQRPRAPLGSLSKAFGVSLRCFGDVLGWLLTSQGCFGRALGANLSGTCNPFGLVGVKSTSSYT